MAECRCWGPAGTWTSVGELVRSISRCSLCLALVLFAACSGSSERTPAAPTEPTAQATALTKEQMDAKAGELADELAELDVRTVGALSTAGSLSNPGDVPQSSSGKTKKGTGTQPAVFVGGASVPGVRVGNASAVIMGMKGRFRRCYLAGLKQHPDMQG